MTVLDEILRDLDQRDLLDRARKVALAYHVTVPEILEPNRFRPAEWARHDLWHSLFAEGCWSYSRLGKLFRRDRSTIQYGVRSHQARLEQKGAA